MEVKVIEHDQIARIVADGILIWDTASFLDLLMAVQQQTGCSKIILERSVILEDFFDLKTKLLGDAFQKLVTYDFKLGIVGDFSMYHSKSLKDYIYESNRNGAACFVQTEQAAVEWLKR